MTTAPRIVEDRTSDSFSSAFGSRRGATKQIPLGEQHPETFRHALELLDQIRAGVLAQTVRALNTLTPDPDYQPPGPWPHQDVADRQAQRDNDRRWMPADTLPTDDQAECDHDAADLVLRTVAEQLGTWAARQWEPVMRDFSHMIGLRRYDMADHVIEIDGTIHLYLPANVLLAGDRGYTSTCACGLSTTDPAYRGKIRPVARGVWRTLFSGNDALGRTHCSDCARNPSRIHGADDCRWEGADDWTPLPPLRWQEMPTGASARTYTALRRQPHHTVQSLQRLALAQARGVYLMFMPELMQTNDKPCLWYRAPGLTEDEMWEVHQRTYDHRLYTGAVKQLTALFPAPTEDGLPQPLADDAGERYRATLLGLVRARAESEK